MIMLTFDTVLASVCVMCRHEMVNKTSQTKTIWQLTVVGGRCMEE